MKNVFVTPTLAPLKDLGSAVVVLSDDEGTPAQNQHLTPTLKELDINLIVQALEMYKNMSFG